MRRMLLLGFLAVSCLASADGSSQYLVSDSGGVGRQFDGIGGLSGGGVSFPGLLFFVCQTVWPKRFDGR